VALVVVAIAGGILAQSPDDGGDDIVIDQPSPTTATSAPEGTPTPSAPATTTSSQPDESTTTTSSGPAVDSDTPLSRSGVGPIRAGMTIDEATAAAGVTLQIDLDAWDAFGQNCGVFEVVGTDLLVVGITPQRAVTDDPSEARVVAVGALQGDARTEEGIGKGSTVDDVYETYGQPTSTEPDSLSDGPGAQVLIYEEGGYSYGFRVAQGQVQEVRSGHVHDIGLEAFEPCA
jgi:hypothetical protein